MHAGGCLVARDGNPQPLSRFVVGGKSQLTVSEFGQIGTLEAVLGEVRLSSPDASYVVAES